MSTASLRSVRRALHLLPVAVLFAACAPQSAVLTSGEYYAFLSDTTSFSLQKGAVNPEDWGAQGTDWWTVDCRELSKTEKETIGLPDPIGGVCNNWVDVAPTDGIVDRPEDETWFGQTPWWIVHEQLEPWRGEAVITSEGDIQVSFHHRLPGGADFRFAFVIDPNFAPVQCDIETGDAVPMDGDWVTGWSEDTLADLAQQAANDRLAPSLDHMTPFLDNGSLFFLNAGAYQFNPDQTTDLWFLPEQWEAGYAATQFSEEGGESRAPRWATNEVYEYQEVYDPGEGYFTQVPQSELYFCELDEGEDPTTSTCVDDLGIRLDEIADAVEEDFGEVQVPWRPLVHRNFWRPSDGIKAGFDGWMELHYNWVVLDLSPDQVKNLAAGDSVSGAFTLTFDGTDSSSRFLVRGAFEVPKLKDDNWVTEDLRARKLEENGNELCFLQ